MLTGIIKPSELGMLIADRMRLAHRPSGLSCEPDMAFVTWNAIRSNRLQLVTNEQGQVMHLEGIPDMVMEIVTNSSVRKDTVDLLSQYAAAQISEYWLVDVRKPTVRFEILRWSPTGFSAFPSQEGWQSSQVFNHDFRLVRSTNPLGKPQFTLESR